jgi:hypothetical protein
VGSLEKWRERCALVLASGWVPWSRRWPMPELWRQGVAMALTVARDAKSTEEAFQAIAEALRCDCSDTYQHNRPGLGASLTWLREEMAKDPDHA